MVASLVGIRVQCWQPALKREMQKTLKTEKCSLGRQMSHSKVQMDVLLLVMFSTCSGYLFARQRLKGFLCHDTLHSHELPHCSPPLQLSLHLTVAATSTACCLHISYVSQKRPRSQQWSWKHSQVPSHGVAPGL